MPTTFDDLSARTTLSDLPEAFLDELTTIRRHLHMHPEVGGQERETAAFIRARLEAYGLDVRGPVADTGLYVDIEGAHPGRMVAYRADIDALPTQDAKRVPYASRCAGVAHLCGHDAHTTVGLGVARLLQQMRDEIHGSVRVFFQPNEEGTPGGAIDMVRDGILEGVEAAYAIHVDPTLPTGRYGLLTGAITAAADQFRIRVHAGRTGHSARPHETRDTIWIATQIANALYQIVGRLTDARNASVLTICRFRAGAAYNVIPAEAEFGGTVRTTSTEDRAYLHEQIHRITREIGTLYETEVDVAIQEGAPPVINDGRMVAHLEATLRELYGEEAVYHIPRPSMGAEDFAHYLEHVPGMLLRVGTSSGPETSFPLHDASFDLDEFALAPTALLMAHTLVGHLRKNILG